jgi:GNAT superfamily N-acetyltransferase
VQQPEIRVRPVGDGDRPMIAWLMLELWGSALQVVHQTLYRPAELPGLIAERGGRVAGLLTFQTDRGVLEVVTLNALERRAGVGTLLMDAVAAEARQRRCQEIRLTTTNDRKTRFARSLMAPRKSDLTAPPRRGPSWGCSYGPVPN